MKQQQKIISKIIKLRLSQLLVNERFKNGDFEIPIHLALGHESIAIAIDEAISNLDSLILNHRNMHFNLARIQNLKDAMDEYYLKETGISRGQLGSMNMSNPEQNIVYSSSILANNLSIATGYALGNMVKGNKAVVFVITGDGAIEEGSFWENLIFAKSNNLKILIIVENNRWSLGTEIQERRCDIDLKKLAKSVGIKYKKLNGNDPFNYINEVNSLKQKSIKKSSPILLEVDLTTLGYWYKKTDEFPKGKYINYHAGPAMSVQINKYPILSDSEEDPLFVLKNYLKESDLIKITDKIKNDLEIQLK